MLTTHDAIINQAFLDLQIQKLATTTAFEILSISLEEAAIFPDHISPTHAFLLVLEGAIEFQIQNENYLLGKHQLFDFPGNTTHRVVAREDSKFLIIR